MSANSKIQWTNKTWNPIAAFLKRDITVEIGGKQRVIPEGTRGWFCVKCSPGCANCYAEGINLRLGNGLTYLHRNLADIEFRLVNLEDPLKWRKPCMVFVNSMTDLFLEHIQDEMIDRVFAVMALARQHTFQVLTKRARRMHEYFSDRMTLEERAEERIANYIIEREPEALHAWPHLFDVDRDEHGKIDNWRVQLPLPNVWLGVSVEDQKRADERRECLRSTPAVVKFVSYEPALENVDWTGWEFVDQIIFGGESGPRARECDPEWGRNAMAFCRANGIKFFCKQLGARVQVRNKAFDFLDIVHLKDSKGGDPSEWPDDLRGDGSGVREFPEIVTEGSK